MSKFEINGIDYLSLVKGGANNLGLDIERINALNVFPVPDGDTGTNMKMTIDGGVNGGESLQDTNLATMSKAMARSMVLSARGNSGVILSQFFKGISLGLAGKEKASVKEFGEALVSGTKKAYDVVQNPTEGTILTVIRLAGENALSSYKEGMSLEDYLSIYIKEADAALQTTPDLLPVLKKAGVIDSGGAGLVVIANGMLKSLLGENEEVTPSNKIEKKKEKLTFNADSTLTFGYCTEFVLQLQNSKVDTKNFDLNIINEFLEKVGNSIVSFMDEDIVKVHVHTMDPGTVFTEMRKYGEFLSLKAENMNLQNAEHEDFYQGKEIEALSAPKLKREEKEHKEYATVVVASGDGIVQAFKDMGVDEVVSGGQTMNTSTQDFIDAFDQINASVILVYPNNSNIKMAAKVAADNYDKARVYVIPTKTISEGYSAVSMLNTDSNDINQIMEEQMEIVNNLSTLEITYSIRDTQINDLDIKKNDIICLYNDELIASNENKMKAIESAFKAIPDFEEKAVLTVIKGKDSTQEEYEELVECATRLNSFIEVYELDGEQDVYSFIIGIE